MLMHYCNLAWWLAVRMVVTLACAFTLWHVAAAEYLAIPFNTLLVSIVLLVIMIRFWAPKVEKIHDS